MTSTKAETVCQSRPRMPDSHWAHDFPKRAKMIEANIARRISAFAATESHAKGELLAVPCTMPNALF
jgi:hypothetical protein